MSHPVDGTTASFGADQMAGLGLGLCLFVPSLLVFFGVILGQLRRLRGGQSLLGARAGMRATLARPRGQP